MHQGGAFIVDAFEQVAAQLARPLARVALHAGILQRPHGLAKHVAGEKGGRRYEGACEGAACPEAGDGECQRPRLRDGERTERRVDGGELGEGRAYAG